jgi:PEP-CTERM motif
MHRYDGGALKILAAPAAAVPEPATWGIMLLGFAGLGFRSRNHGAKPHSGNAVIALTQTIC